MINPTNTAVVQTTEVRTATVVPFKNPSLVTEDKAEGVDLKKKTQAVLEEKRREAEVQKALEKTVLEQHEEKQLEEVSQKMLDELSMDIEMLHSVGLSFSKHDDTGRTIVKVINKDTDELIREIPSEQVLDMAAKLDEMVGILFDTKV